MKSMNFTAREILPSLLDKSKIQTIKKTWCNEITLCFKGHTKEGLHLPKYKVGDIVKIVWNRDSDYNTFCENCSGGIHYAAIAHSCAGKTTSIPLEKLRTFDKNLGKVKITEVFEIEMWSNATGYCFLPYSDSTIILDGFVSPKSFFKYFAEKYDLSSPKKFYVYRWKWIDETIQ